MMNVDLKEKFFWFIFVELLCGFTASVAFLTTSWYDVLEVVGKTAGSATNVNPSSISLYTGKLIHSLDFKGSTVVLPASGDTKYGWKSVNDSDISHVGSKKNASVGSSEAMMFSESYERRKSSSYIENMLLPGAFLPMVFRTNLFVYDMSLDGKPLKLILMLCCIVFYLMGGICLVIDNMTTSETVRGIFAIIAGSIMIVDLVFLIK